MKKYAGGGKADYVDNDDLAGELVMKVRADEAKAKAKAKTAAPKPKAPPAPPAKYARGGGIEIKGKTKGRFV